MRKDRQDPDLQQADRNQESQLNRASETDRAEPDEHGSETAKDVNVVRGDDRPQAVRHSG